MDNLPEHIERALHAHFRFHRDPHYLVDKDKVVIIDEFTCRRMPEETGRPAIHIAAAVRASLLLGRVHPHRRSGLMHIAHLVARRVAER